MSTRRNPIFLAPWLYYLGLTLIVGGTGYVAYKAVKDHYDKQRQREQEQAHHNLTQAAGWGALAIAGIGVAVVAVRAGDGPSRYGGEG